MSVLTPYTPPSHGLRAFHCAICNAYAGQLFGTMSVNLLGLGATLLTGYSVSRCAHCGLASLWRGEMLVDSILSSAPLPNADLPDDIKADYEEARAILPLSPRGAAALLRLAIQKLCKHLGEPGKTLTLTSPR